MPKKELVSDLAGTVKFDKNFPMYDDDEEGVNSGCCDACLHAGQKKIAIKKITIGSFTHKFCEDCYIDFLLKMNKEADKLMGQVRLYCLRCGQSWNPRGKKPKKCPKCTSPYWDRRRKS
jgi:predicted Zn-ribbon and HTH transcriptional regulator